MTLRDLVRGQLRSVTLDQFAGYSPRSMGNGAAPVTESDAMRHSAVWASLRVRANLLSSLDVHCFREFKDSTGDTLQFPVNLPPVMVQPSPGIYFPEFLYSSQVDLDRYGNTFGLIKARDALGFPMRIDLVPATDVRVKLAKDGTITYRIGQREYPRDEVWHERQYTVAGVPVGLSPLSHAAMTISQYKSAQDFSISWYTNNAVPAGHLKNTGKKLPADEARLIKDRFKSAMQGGGDVFVTGMDWEFSPVVAESNDQIWLASMQASSADIARFFDVPADLIGAASAPGASITYANITQRFLQLLIVHLGPTLKRRRNAFSNGLMSKPRHCEFAVEQLLQMDPAALSTMLGQQIRDRIRTPNEVRNTFYNLPDLDDADLAEFVTSGMGGTPAPPPALPAAPTDGSVSDA
jgi:HK97 family phage portal protein